MLAQRSRLMTLLMGQGETSQTAILPAGKDTYLDSSNPTYNFGARDILGFGSTRFPTLMYFDLTAIPAGSTCLSATLKLYRAAQSTPGAFIGTVYAIKVGNDAWGEGNNTDGAGGSGECSWNNKDQGASTAWAGSAGLATAGTDYETGSIGSFSGNISDAVGTQYAIALTNAAVAAWFGNAANYGIKIAWSAGTGQLASRHHATAAYRPSLTITYREGG